MVPWYIRLPCFCSSHVKSVGNLLTHACGHVANSYRIQQRSEQEQGFSVLKKRELLKGSATFFSSNTTNLGIDVSGIKIHLHGAVISTDGYTTPYIFDEQ